MANPKQSSYPRFSGRNPWGVSSLKKRKFIFAFLVEFEGKWRIMATQEFFPGKLC
jgi:hypothetical protein